MPRDILLGVVTGAHGLKGEVKVKTFTEALAAYGALHAQDGRAFDIVSARLAKPDLAIVRFRGIEDRAGAEALKGCELFVARDALPPTEAEEFYHADLVGLAAFDDAGDAQGTVKGVHNFGAGDVIEIARADGGELFLPFTRASVPVVDVKAGRIVVVRPEETDADEEGKVA